MKTLNKKTAKEIGFDIDCLPKWAKYLYLCDDNNNLWFFSNEPPVFDIVIGVNISYGDYGSIPKKHEPTNFKGDWTESLFKIERE